ncbi:hypothetical protein ACA910_020613 [Epithemia clementina (nom. ined.)]
MTTKVDAKCLVQDRHGRTISLQSSQVLPRGVSYDASKDQLTCHQPSACRQWTIAQCQVVKCVHSHACQEAHFVNNTSVSCFQYAACQESHFVHTQTISCGMHAVNSCLQATIPEPTMSLICWGQHACVNDYHTQMTVNVGTRGFVACLSSGGGNAYSCRHMVVLVDHARRACLAVTTPTNAKTSSTSRTKEFLANGEPPPPPPWPSSVEQGHCAVYCEGEGECDEDTIHFKVVSQ